MKTKEVIKKGLCTVALMTIVGNTWARPAKFYHRHYPKCVKIVTLNTTPKAKIVVVKTKRHEPVKKVVIIKK